MTREQKNEYLREWRRSHPENIVRYEAGRKEPRAAYLKAYKEKHRERLSVLARAQYVENRGAEIDAMRRWRVANPERAKASSKAWYEANKERTLENVRVWRAANPDCVRAYRKLREARDRSSLWFSYGELVSPHEVFKRDKWRCRACGCKTPKELRGTIEPNAPELDHVIPLSLGGPHTRKNLQCLCRSCNSKKSAKYEGQLAFA